MERGRGKLSREDGPPAPLRLRRGKSPAHPHRHRESPAIRSQCPKRHNRRRQEKNAQRSPAQIQECRRPDGRFECGRLSTGACPKRLSAVKVPNRAAVGAETDETTLPAGGRVIPLLNDNNLDTVRRRPSRDGLIVGIPLPRTGSQTHCPRLRVSSCSRHCLKFQDRIEELRQNFRLIQLQEQPTL